MLCHPSVTLRLGLVIARLNRAAARHRRAQHENLVLRIGVNESDIIQPGFQRADG
jgi:hypothetical protein